MSSENQTEISSTLFLQQLGLGRVPVERVAIAALNVGGTPRLAGKNLAHCAVLAQTEMTLPPIIVRRATMTVIDGAHRMHAATLRGQRAIDVHFFDGTESEAFVLAVEANIQHGLPLSREDRMAAAIRIIATQPQWSDRAIAEVTGLSANTIRDVRRRATAQSPQLHRRIGRDGRMRPMNSAQGRERARKLLIERPEASLREIAKEAGISPGTVRDVRERLRQGRNVVPSRQRSAGPAPVPQQGAPYQAAVRPAPEDLNAMLRTLVRDPSLRFPESGRKLLRLLDLHLMSEEQWTQLADNIPDHCRQQIVALGRACVSNWARFVDGVENGRQRCQDREGTA